MTHPHIPGSRRRRHHRLVLAGPVLALGLLLTGCSGGSSDSSAGDTSGGFDVPADAAPLAEEDMAAARDGAKAGSADAGGAPSTAVRQPAIISTGTVSLRSGDVGQARFDVQTIVDEHGGSVTDERTDTGKDGTVLRSRMVLRIPSAEFAATMDQLEKVASLASSDTTSEDVTTQVIDTEVRIRAQEQSLRRIELLLDRAQSIRDIVSIESELTRRQAELDSLKQQQAWLADQTSLSTITVHLQRTTAAKPPRDDKAGFLVGLRRGWHGLVAFASGAATVVGALLPWLVVLALLAVPGWLLGRRLVRRGPRLQPAGPVAESAES